jgi:hypothetical protein
VTFGIDYAATTPDPKALKKSGVKFVCRYVSTDGNPKNITAEEVKALHEAGLDIVIVFETTADAALGGYKAGLADAASARKQTQAVGLGNCVIYFAVDFDASPVQLVTVRQYFRGVEHVLGRKKAGVYGGYKTVKSVLDLKAVKFGWQTYAWSNGAWDRRAQLRQVANAQVVCGVACDHDTAHALNYGQTPGPLKKVKHKVKHRVKAAWDSLANEYARWKNWRKKVR